MPQQRYYLAIDIGASSGRHVLGSVNGNGVIELEEVHRFDNVQVRRRGHDCWDIDMIWENILVGLEKCRKAGKIPETIGIDTWAVDFVLVDAQGRLVGDAVAYRDARTNDVAADVDAGIGLERLYRVTGIQRQAFNTVYQLAALSREHPEELEAADRFLMVPEYLNYLLTGHMVNEYTNATTTNLVNARTCTWDSFALEAAEAPARLFGEIAMPGTVVGGLAPEVQQRVGFDARVMLPATHDTGSAFLAVPARDAQAVYLSSGTWSLLGVEHEGPITSDASRYQNFTNEGGYLKRFRFLKNIMGLWMIQSIRRELNGVSYVSGKGAQLKRAAKEIGFGELADAARAEQKLHPDAPVPHVNVNDDRFLAPASMIEEDQGRLSRDGPACAGYRRRVDALRIREPDRLLRRFHQRAVGADRPYVHLHQHRRRGMPGHLPQRADGPCLRHPRVRRPHRGHQPGQPYGADDRRWRLRRSRRGARGHPPFVRRGGISA